MTHMKSIFCTIIIISTVFVAHAQLTSKYLKYHANPNYIAGQIINEDLTITDGLIKAYRMFEMKKYHNVKFVAMDGVKTKLLPSDIRGYQYAGHEFVAHNASFMEVVTDGARVKLYKTEAKVTYSTQTAPGLPMNTYVSRIPTYYVQKTGSTEFRKVNYMLFKEKFGEYFSDCESVKKLIENKVLKASDIKAIVDRYNNCE